MPPLKPTNINLAKKKKKTNTFFPFYFLNHFVIAVVTFEELGCFILSLVLVLLLVINFVAHP